jgi:outer membrane protein
MKKIITLVAIAVLSISTVSAQKYGHLNAQEVLKGMAEYSSAQQEMERYGKQKEKELKMMQSSFKSDYEKYEAQAKTLSPEIRESRESDLLETQQTIQAFQQKVQEKLQSKEVELLEPIIKKVREAITAVGKANSFTYIFDTSVGALLYFEGGNDVTELIKKQLAKPVSTPAVEK